MRTGFRWFLASALVLSPVLPARAQSVFAGTVRDARTHILLAGVEVSIADLGLTARSDPRGRFRIEDVNAGRYRVVLRRAGYDSLSLLVPFSGEDSVTRDVLLASIGQPLPEVPVRAESRPVTDPRLAEFEDRRHGGVGHFLTLADLEKEQDRRLSDIVQKLPGVVIARARSGTAAYVLSSRGQVSIENGGTFGLNCPVAVWLDGTHVYRGNDRSAGQKTAFGQSTVPPGQGLEPPFDINQLNTKSIAAIEFYAGPAQLPARFNITQGTCGALVIWTR